MKKKKKEPTLGSLGSERARVAWPCARRATLQDEGAWRVTGVDFCCVKHYCLRVDPWDSSWWVLLGGTHGPICVREFSSSSIHSVLPSKFLLQTVDRDPSTEPPRKRRRETKCFSNLSKGYMQPYGSTTYISFHRFRPFISTQSKL